MPFTSLSKILECWESQQPAESSLSSRLLSGLPSVGTRLQSRGKVSSQLIAQPELWAAHRVTTWRICRPWTPGTRPPACCLVQPAATGWGQGPREAGHPGLSVPLTCCSKSSSGFPGKMMTHDPGSAEINQTAERSGKLRKTDCWESNLNSLRLCFPTCKMGVVTIVSGNSSAVQQWLELFAFTAEGPSSIPGHRTKILPWSSDSKEFACSEGNPGLLYGLKRSLEEGNGNPLQFCCLENSMGRGAWQSTIHGVAE